MYKVNNSEEKYNINFDIHFLDQGYLITYQGKVNALGNMEQVAGLVKKMVYDVMPSDKSVLHKKQIEQVKGQESFIK